MPKLPAAPTTRHRRAVWNLVLCGGIERLTEELRAGREFDEADLADMQTLAQRLDGFRAALEMRVQIARAQGEVIEDE